MTETPGQVRELGRRALLRNALITGAGAAALAAISVPLASTADAAIFQPNWGFCTQCDEIFWAGGNFTSSGSCTANLGHSHTLGGTNYFTEYGASSSGNPADPSSSGQQAGWRWCTACSALFWPGTSNDRCPGTSVWIDGRVEGFANHDAGTTNYAVPFGITNNSDYQGGWCYCHACGVLYWAGQWGKNAGVCLGNTGLLTPPGPHLAGSSTHYQMIFT
jgi:hypothetical protein